jgi:hypothetical protein
VGLAAFVEMGQAAIRILHARRVFLCTHGRNVSVIGRRGGRRDAGIIAS